MQIKLLAVFAFVLLALVILLVRITYIITTKGNTYAKQVLSQQSYDSQTIPYRRGEILDRNGVILAKSDRVYNLIMDCRAVNSDEDYIEPTIHALKEVYDLDETDLRNCLQNETTADSQYHILMKNISEEQKKAWEDYVSTDSDKKLSDEEIRERNNIQGIWFEEKYVRDYPYSTLASKVIGFSNDSGDGIAGIENYYDNLLKGTNGRTYGYLNSDDEYEKKTIEPEHGKKLTATLDMNVQEIVEKHIRQFDEEYGDEESNGKGAKNVAVLVMNPNNGEILSMASNSEFDLNNPYDLTDTYTGAQIKAMSDEEYSNALNERWSNFCVSSSYEPGSVVKPITVASALQVGAVTDGEHFYCDGYEFITDTRINCDNIYGHGDETLEYAIVNSCNDALMQIAMKMGISNFTAYQQLFGFGSRTGIDLPNETTGVIYTRDTMHEVELATCSFGQGFTCSMVQEAAAFSAAINGGYYYQPHVLKQVQDSEGTVEKTVTPLLLKQPVSSANSALIRRYITTAVQKGTGQKSQVPGYLTGGKTGTAEKIDPETGKRAKGKYLVSFIGACPMDDPQVLIYVIVDEPNVEDQADSSYPQVLFREIATEVFPYLGLYPTEDVTQTLLASLGLTEDDVVQGNASGKQTFNVYGSDGNYYYNCYIKDGTVVSSGGEPVDGCTINEDGNVVDYYGNIIDITDTSAQKDDLDPVADNPDMASPPQELDDSGTGDRGTSWNGVTAEDLENN